MGYEFNYPTYGLRVEPVYFADEITAAANGNVHKCSVFGTIVPHGVFVRYYDTCAASDYDDNPRLQLRVLTGNLGSTAISSGVMRLVGDVQELEDTANEYLVWVPRTTSGECVYTQGASTNRVNSTTTYALDAGGTGRALFGPAVVGSGNNNAQANLEVQFYAGTGTDNDGRITNVVVSFVYTVLPINVADLTDEEVAQLDRAAEKVLFGVGVDDNVTGPGGYSRYI